MRSIAGLFAVLALFVMPQAAAAQSRGHNTGITGGMSGINNRVPPPRATTTGRGYNTGITGGMGGINNRVPRPGAGASVGRRVLVRGYTRANGTRVGPYARSASVAQRPTPGNTGITGGISGINNQVPGAAPSTPGNTGITGGISGINNRVPSTTRRAPGNTGITGGVSGINNRVPPTTR